MVRCGSLGLGLLGFAVACATGQDVEGSSSATFTGPMVTVSASASASASNTGGDSGTDEDSGAQADSGDSDPTAADAASDGASMGPGMQPEDGMYSDCLMASECVGLNTCVTILDTMDMPTDGFCSNNACEDPTTDCEGTPAGDTVPFCMALTLNGQEDTVCALDCSGETPCPGGMICWDLGAVQVCA